MVDDFEGMFSGFGVLEFFYRIIFKFNNLATLHANKVIVMFPALGTLVEFLAAAKILFLENLALFQKRQRPVNRCLGDSLVFSFGYSEKLVGGKMAVGRHGLA